MTEPILDSNGLRIPRLNEVIDTLIEQYRIIYGQDIIVDTDSPDGQRINIEALANHTYLDLLRSVYNSFNPETAQGQILDERCAINGVFRSGATYSIILIDVTATMNTRLSGIDGENPFTVSDGNGNDFQLLESVDIEAGTTSLVFRAAMLGDVKAQPNRITTMVTIVRGVTAVNNPNAPYSIGVNEENDMQLRIRRSRSLGLPSIGVLSGLEASLLAVNDVILAQVYENYTTVTDANGNPPHSIWVIVDGGDTQEIAKTIHKKRNMGVGMRGEQQVNVRLENETTFTTIRFDRPYLINAWVRVSVKSLSGTSISIPQITDAILDGVIVNVFETLDRSMVDVAIKNSNNDLMILSSEVSEDGENWFSFLEPDRKNDRFILSQDRIIVNG